MDQMIFYQVLNLGSDVKDVTVVSQIFELPVVHRVLPRTPKPRTPSLPEPWKNLTSY